MKEKNEKKRKPIPAERCSQENSYSSQISDLCLEKAWVPYCNIKIYILRFRNLGCGIIAIEFILGVLKISKAKKICPFYINTIEQRMY